MRSCVHFYSSPKRSECLQRHPSHLSPSVRAHAPRVELDAWSTACTSPTAPPTSTLTPVTVQLSWSHQAEFAGLYAADQLGYFAAEGLQVTFVEGGPEVDFITPVANGTAQFGIAQPADVILARAAGKPVRSVAVIYRRNPIAFFAMADSGITRPQDFVGKKIRSAVTVDQTLRAMMARVGIRPDQYEIVYLPSDVSLFASREVPVWSGFINVFALDVQRAGYQLNFIYPDDYGIHFYGDVLITTDDLDRAAARSGSALHAGDAEGLDLCHRESGQDRRHRS